MVLTALTEESCTWRKNDNGMKRELVEGEGKAGRKPRKVSVAIRPFVAIRFPPSVTHAPYTRSGMMHEYRKLKYEK